MKLRRLFFPLLLTLVIGGGLVGGLVARAGKTEYEPVLASSIDGRSLTSQPTSKRVWKPLVARKVFSLASRDEAPLFGPLQLRVDEQEDLFVLDAGELKIKRFTPDGRFIESYGNGKGQGPGEFLSITDFAVGPDGRVWTADLSNGRLSIFAPGGKLERTVKMEAPPYRLALSSDGFFLMFALLKDSLFGRFNSQGRLQQAFGRYLVDQQWNSMVLDGVIAPDGAGGFVYAASYAGLIAAYGADGAPRFIAETIDRPELPKIVRTKGRMWVDREAPRTAYNVTVDSGGIHLLGVLTSGVRNVPRLDTYDLATGRYLYSRELPETCARAHLVRGHLYTVRETSVTKWALGS